METASVGGSSASEVGSQFLSHEYYVDDVGEIVLRVMERESAAQFLRLFPIGINLREDALLGECRYHLLRFLHVAVV